MTELKRCPHCGSKAVYVHSMAYDWVKCGNMNCHNTATISVRYWNTRPIEDELNARIAQLEAERDAWKADAERLSEFDCSVTENSILETRLADCESALKSMVEQYCYDGEILGKLYYCHGFMSAGENAFWYLVKYDLAEYVAGKKSKLTFKAQQAQGTVTVEDGYHEITGKQIYRPDEAIE